MNAVITLTWNNHPQIIKVGKPVENRFRDDWRQNACSNVH